MPIETVPGISALVEKTVLSVFRELRLSSAAWVEQSKLLTVGRRRYGRFVEDHFATFPLFGAGRTASVDSSYVRVTLTENIEREKYKSREELVSSLKQQQQGKVRGQDDPSLPTPFRALDRTSRHFALLGTAGSGKTTVFKHLTLQLARGVPLRSRKRLPLYIAVRDLADKKTSIQTAARLLLEDLGVDTNGPVLARLLRSGRMVLLLDGLDETDAAHQKELLQEVAALSRRYESVIVCLSGRPHSLSVALPATFTRWEMLPLSLTARMDFVEKWFHSVEPGKGERLLAECSGRPEILDLGSSPLLLSIVCALYHNDLHIPSEPEELYERALEGLLGRWDAFRNVARQTVLGQVPMGRRLLLMSWLAAGLFDEGLTVFSTRDVERNSFLRRGLVAIRAKPILADELVACLFNDFGILAERSPGLYSFSHLTFQEYLTARYICHHRREQKLLFQRRQHPEWFDVFRLVARLLPTADRFMADLTIATDLTDSYEVSLLRAAWDATPIVSSGPYQELMERVCEDLESILKARAHKVKREGSSLWLQVEDLIGWKYRDSIGNLLAIALAGRTHNDITRKRRRSFPILSTIPTEGLEEVRVFELHTKASDIIRSAGIRTTLDHAERQLRRLLDGTKPRQ